MCLLFIMKVEVFWKDQVQSLPLHRPYDCTIDLLPGAPLPTSCLVSLSLPEQEAMEKYISCCRHHPCLLFTGHSGFFFVKKKDKTRWPCIDYRGLNNITVKNKYTLLLTFAFELLQGVVLLTLPQFSLVNDILRDFSNRFVFIYLNDILIFSKSKQVRQVLQWLLENWLYVKNKK